MFRLELQSSSGEGDKMKFEWAVIYSFINFPVLPLLKSTLLENERTAEESLDKNHTRMYA